MNAIRKHLCVVLLLSTTQLFSQNRTEDFTITLPEQKVSNSLYNKLRFIDSRDDTTQMGIVQLGAFNKKAKVVPELPIGEQLEKVFQSTIDNSAKDGELLLQLQKLSFAEVTGAMSEKGYFHFRAKLYGKQSDTYRQLSNIDTVVLIKAMDVTRPLFRKGSSTITDFIASNITTESNNASSFSYDQIVGMDDIEKAKIALYNAGSYKDGIYKSYSSLSKQEPDIIDYTAELTEKGKPTKVKVKEDNGKYESIKSKEVYAIVHKQKLYMATDFGYYPVQKKGNDFYFTGMIKSTADQADVMMASLFFGVIGGLIASSSSHGLFEMKVDHATGGFIRLKELPPVSRYSQDY